MANGRTMRTQGRLDAALTSFKAADAIMHAPTTGLEVARTLESLGRLVDALGAARKVQSTPLSTGDPAPFLSALAAANALASELEQRIPTLAFVMEGFDDMPTIAVDGRAVPAGDLGAPLRLDPGVHKVVAHLGQLDASQIVELHERDRQPIVIKSPRPPHASGASAESTEGAWRTFAYVSFGTGAAGLLVGAVTGALALSAKSAADASCHNGRCTDDGEASRRYAAASAAGFATFGTALGLGLMGLALTPSRESSRGTLRVRPQLGAGIGGGSVELEGTF